MLQLGTYLSHDNLARAMYIPVTARLNYFNSVVHEFSAGFLYCLQLLQTVAVYLITGLSSCHHITPTLHSSHWLPTQWQIDF